MRAWGTRNQVVVWSPRKETVVSQLHRLDLRPSSTRATCAAAGPAELRPTDGLEERVEHGRVALDGHRRRGNPPVAEQHQVGRRTRDRHRRRESDTRERTARIGRDEHDRYGLAQLPREPDEFVDAVVGDLRRDRLGCCRRAELRVPTVDRGLLHLMARDRADGPVVAPPHPRGRVGIDGAHRVEQVRGRLAHPRRDVEVPSGSATSSGKSGWTSAPARITPAQNRCTRPRCHARSRSDQSGQPGTCASSGVASSTRREPRAVGVDPCDVVERPAHVPIPPVAARTEPSTGRRPAGRPRTRCGAPRTRARCTARPRRATVRVVRRHSSTGEPGGISSSSASAFVAAAAAIVCVAPPSSASSNS